MKHKCRTAMAGLLILTLMLTLGLGCGEEDNGDQEVTITIGQITDITGPAGTAYRAVNLALTDQIRDINENDRIPGVKLEVATYDTGYDLSKDIPGYEWCKQRGAEVIMAGLPSAEVFKPFAEKDKIAVVTLAVSKTMVDPPGWLFAMNAPVSYQVKAFLKWISEEYWDEARPAKIGSVGWGEPYHVEITEAIEEYATAHTEDFEYVAGIIAPSGTVNWSADINTLIDCDYVWIPSTGTDTVTFAQQFRDHGGTSTFINGDAMDAFRGLLLDAVGWDGMEGSISAHGSTRFWGEPYPVIELGEEILNMYHANEAAEIIYGGIGYIGGFQQARAFLDVLQKAIEKVGAESFNGQAFYDTAIETEVTWEGYEPWGFAPNKRYAWGYIGIYKWSESADNIIRFVPDWIPNLIE